MKERFCFSPLSFPSSFSAPQFFLSSSFFFLKITLFATFKGTLKCENSDVMETGPWCWQQYFSHSGEHVCNHKLVFGSIICSNNTVIYKVPLSKQNLEYADHTNYKHVQRCRVKNPRPLVFLKTDFWKYKSPLTCFSNCIFLKAPCSPHSHPTPTPTPETHTHLDSLGFSNFNLVQQIILICWK